MLEADRLSLRRPVDGAIFAHLLAAAAQGKGDSDAEREAVRTDGAQGLTHVEGTRERDGRIRLAGGMKCRLATRNDPVKAELFPRGVGREKSGTMRAPIDRLPIIWSSRYASPREVQGGTHGQATDCRADST